MESVLRKWRALYGVYAQDWLAYKANGVIWILTDLVTAITMPLVWASAAKSGLIQGYDAASFTVYYLAMLMTVAFVTSHIMWEIGFEIKEGQFTTYLVRPMSFVQTMFVRNFAWRSIRFVMTIPFLIALYFAYGSMLQGATVFLGWQFWAAFLLGHFVSFSFVLALASLALYFQEATTIFELHYVPQLFLSGYMFPVALLPGWAQSLALWLPFYYTTGLPVDVLVGKVSPSQAVPLIGAQLLWVGVCFIAGHFLWRSGLKHYTGVGI